MPTKMHDLALLAILAIAACGGDGGASTPTGGDNDKVSGDPSAGDPNGGDPNGDSDTAQFNPQTYDNIPDNATSGDCQDLFDRAEACLGLVDCSGLLPESDFVSNCNSQSFSPQDIGGIVSQSCVDINLQLCPEQDALRACCTTYLTCPSGQVCTDVSDQFGAGAGFCTTAALKVPTANPTCSMNADCPDGPWACEQFNSDSGLQQRCIEVCDPTGSSTN